MNFCPKTKKKKIVPIFRITGGKNIIRLLHGGVYNIFRTRILSYRGNALKSSWKLFNTISFDPGQIDRAGDSTKSKKPKLLDRITYLTINDFFEGLSRSFFSFS